MNTDNNDLRPDPTVQDHEQGHADSQQQVRAFMTLNLPQAVLDRIGQPVGYSNAYFDNLGPGGKEALLDSIVAHETPHGSLNHRGEVVMPISEQEARRHAEQGAMMRKLLEAGKYPLFLMGDLNMGKTEFTRALAEALEQEMLVIDCGQLEGEYVGSTGIHKLLGHPAGYVTFGDDHGLVSLLAGPDDKRADVLLAFMAGDTPETGDTKENGEAGK